MTNICFNCQNACGGCSWSELDPDTRKPRFEPVPGWTAKPVLLHVATSKKKPIIIETYRVTACPQFIPDAARKANFDSLTDEQCKQLESLGGGHDG